MYCWEKEIKIRLKQNININNINSKRIEYGTIKHELDISTVLSTPQLIMNLFGCCWVSYYCSVPGVTGTCVLWKVPYQLYLALIHIRTKCRKSWTVYNRQIVLSLYNVLQRTNDKKSESFIKQILWQWKCREIPSSKIN